ncbi:efflux transporter outer membrane subunit [Pseudomonas sp. Irchel 3F3]|uniref:efflux transporter outer membrane subunit n=1 Tax=Pseudomonas sp. Irchel 3F3 TaxID=2009000 RepID=UPI000BA4684D|nr:efflux transporter outer membrane subunit [Pseudomonas sp. Irchel 3F3]
MTMTRTPLFLLPLLTLLGACSHPPAPLDSGIVAPASWQGPTGVTAASAQWWTTFNSAQLSQLIEQARHGSHDLRAAMARVRQARADLRIAGGPLLPSLDASADAYQQRLLRGQGYSEQDTSSSKRTYRYFDTALTASYELDFWGANAAARDSARLGLQATAFDRDTLELSLTSSVADTYLRALAAREQTHIATLNLENADKILNVVRTRFQAGSSTALELAQQESLVANQQRQLPLYQQEARDAQITLATLLGVPVQALELADQPFDQLRGPSIAAGIPSQLLTRRPDIASAEARLAAAQADVSVARAALFPTVSLTASLATGDRKAIDLLHNPAFNLGAGLTAPIFNNGALRAARDRAIARQDELLDAYRSVLITSFGEVEKALNSVDGLDRQTRWQNEALSQAQRAFDLAENRYRAGAEDLLSVLEAQRSLFAAQAERVRLREARLQASVALYKALGGGWTGTDARMTVR